eukprot:scaffold50237_cov62-Phaeocystis_antarctica.AAC.2
MQDAMVVARPGPGGKRALSLLPMSPPGRVLESRELSVSCTCPVRFIKPGTDCNPCECTEAVGTLVMTSG